MVTCKYPDGTNQQKTLPRTDDGDRCKLAIADAIDRFIHSFHVCGEGQEYCGLYGFTSFNAVRYFENIAVRDTTMEKMMPQISIMCSSAMLLCSTILTIP